MAEYIDKGELIDFVKDSYGGGNEENTCIWYRDLIDFIQSAPAADVVPVVRCKECKHYLYQGINAGWVCMKNAFGMGKDDFCSYGERRER